MMETMIPPQVGMRLRTKKKERKEAKKSPPKKEKNREVTMLLSFSTLVI